ncbi:MAG TPA: hypothetical protein VKT78_19435 [Fimbriimonadaceae bacterium]|nr:hypothetical protein [Fimbriimonadaceae bacterium]
MKSLILLGALLFTSSPAQVEPQSKEAAASKAYHAYRLVETPPAYGFQKVQRLVNRIKANNEDNLVLPAREYNALTTNEKFTYCMVHAENLDQNCAEMPAIVGESRKIFAYTPGPFFDQYTWSPRQMQFLKGHRGTVVQLLRATIKRRRRVGVNLKKAMVELEAKELIPDILAVFKHGQKDKDILTVCCNLMKSGSFKPFVASKMYKTLYGDEASSYKSFLPATPATEKQIIVWATKFAGS